MDSTFLLFIRQGSDYQLIKAALETTGYLVQDGHEAIPDAAFALIEWIGNGLAAQQTIRSLRRQQPSCRCLLAPSTDRATVLLALQLNAAGYVALPIVALELIDCLACLNEGDGYWSEALLTLLREPCAQAYPVGLNKREHELWGHLANGLTNQQIEELMCLSTSRVKNLKTELAQKLRLPSAHELTMCAVLWSKGNVTTQ